MNYTLSFNKINDKEILDEKMEDVGYSIEERENAINNLISWIAEAEESDKSLMKEDLKYLMNLKDEYIFSSRSTNNYIAYSDNEAEFDIIASEMLEN